MLLMEAHVAAGNPAEALRAFEDLRRLLREELGAVPGPSVMALHERLLHGRAHAQPAAPAPPPAIAARRWPAPLDAARGRHDFVGRAPEALVLQEAWRPRRRGRARPGRDRRRGRHRQDAPRGRAGGSRPRRRRRGALRPLRRGGAGAVPAGRRDGARLGGRRLARTARRAARLARGRAQLRAARVRPAARGPGRLAAQRRGRHQAVAVVRCDRCAAGGDRRRGAAAGGARRPALGGPADAPADRPPGARAGARARDVPRHAAAATRAARSSRRCSPPCAARGRSSGST